MSRVMKFNDFTRIFENSTDSSWITEQPFKVYLINDPPKVYKGLCIVETKVFNSDKVRYFLCDYVSDSANEVPYPDFKTYVLSTNSLRYIELRVQLERWDDKGLSDTAYEWMENEIESDEFSVEELIKALVKHGNLEDKDYPILGLKKEDNVHHRASKKFGLNR